MSASHTYNGFSKTSTIRRYSQDKDLKENCVTSHCSFSFIRYLSLFANRCTYFKQCVCIYTIFTYIVELLHCFLNKAFNQVSLTNQSTNCPTRRLHSLELKFLIFSKDTLTLEYREKTTPSGAIVTCNFYHTYSILLFTAVIFIDQHLIADWQCALLLSLVALWTGL